MGTAARKTVLLVDDEQSMLKVLERRLVSWGYDVLLAENGQEALRLATERRPNLILLDVMMPAPDGLEVARQLKSAPVTARIPIILVTVKATELSSEEIKASRAVRVIGKPYESKELEEAVRAALA